MVGLAGMTPSRIRFSRMRHLATTAATLGGVGGVALAVLGVVRFDQESGLWMVAAGVGALCISVMALTWTRLLLKIESHASRLYNQVRDLHELLERHQKALNKIAENTLISDAAKSIAHRTEERDALRGAIYEEVRREDFDAAFHLIDDLESRLGYRDQAERLREEIRDACTDAFRIKLKEALKHVNGLMNERRWAQAQKEIERLEKVMPEERRIKDLWKTLDAKRLEHKQELLSSWNAEAAKGNIERCLDILKELDPYLSRDEARSLEASAREVFKERLLQLGVQFQLAVKERRWQDALAAGLEIMEEFPNSRMAQEVRENLAALRARTGIPTDIEVTAREETVSEASDSRLAGEGTGEVR